MNLEERKNHWQQIFATKNIDEVSWYQPKPEASLALIAEAKLAKDAEIIDVGAGDSFLVDFLIAENYQNITVLDISGNAIERAKKRLSEKAKNVHWVVSDVLKLTTSKTFDLWHDRAMFHFLTNKEEIKQYVQIVAKHLNPGGRLILGTFSKEGPTKCSGIPIKQYDVEALKETFSDEFIVEKSVNLNHTTPFKTQQNFTFVSFVKK